MFFRKNQWMPKAWPESTRNLIFSKKHASDRLGRYDELNFGIMYANMMVAAEELWLDVDLIRLEEISQKNFPNSQYMLSAILRL